MSPTVTSTLTVESVRAPESEALLAYADAIDPLVWLRRGEGLVGIGQALRLEFAGPDRFDQAREAWSEVVDAATVHDAVGLSGSGLVAFGSFAFSASSSVASVLIVPRLIIGRRGSDTWITRIAAGSSASPTTARGSSLSPSVEAPGDEYRISFSGGELRPDGYRAAVRAAIARIDSGALDKVVLARDISGKLPRFADLRRALAALSKGYPDCWTFAVDGFLGSSPETLVKADRGEVSARVLAGSAARGDDAIVDRAAADALMSSAKDRKEHEYAVNSVLTALDEHTSFLTSSRVPFALRLPNLWHLASDVSGRLSDGATALDLVAALHPTAAVAGSPTERALEVIDELEPFDRGRYAGPTGWVDAAGDGEWAIALRSAQVDSSGSLTAYAGCGIVSGSDPDRELEETRLKFRPIVEAFG